MAAAEKLNTELLEKLSPIDLVRTKEKITRSEIIPINSITSEVLIIDESHAEELALSMAGDRGQISEITVRARFGGMTGEDVSYDIIDGFHRYEAAKSLGFTTLRASVLYGCTDEEMYDHRILAANSVKSTKFSRLAFWMKGAWNWTPWREKITLAQACNLSSGDASGKTLGLSPKEAEEIKRWVNDKAKKWLIPIGTLSSRFSFIELAAPDLIEKVRLRGGKPGKGRESLTLQKLEIIARAFPGEFEFQKQIASFAVDSAISTEELQAIVEETSTLKDRSDKSAVNEVLYDGRWLSHFEYSPEKRESTLGQLLGSLKEFETLLGRYTALEKEVKEDIFYRIWIIRNEIRQKDK